MRAALLLVAAELAGLASGLPDRLGKILNSSPEAAQSFWAIRVADAETGELIYALNDRKFFIPASNTKLFTTSLALRTLGPDYKFRTRIEADVAPDARGAIHELRLIGGGDPNLSARILPYNQDETGPDPLAAIRKLADDVVSRGVRIIAGDVVGDDSAWVWEPYPDGWAVDDPVFEYGAPVSALTLNDNSFRLTAFPGAAVGDPASFALTPALEYLTIQNRTRTTEPGTATHLNFYRVPGSHELIISGSLPLDCGATSTLLAVDDPALFAASALRDALEQRGVRITGVTRAVHREAGEDPPAWSGVEIASQESAPLSQVIQVVNKVSQNLHTELLLREIARVKTGTGSQEAGLNEIAGYLRELGVEEGQWNFKDASGLSRLTLVTAETIGKVLTSMYQQQPLREVWMASLPVGGVDGTLDKRFGHARQAARIHAKTGSISHVSTLSGYAVREDGRTWAFSILVNNFNGSSAPIRKVMDALTLQLLR